MLRHQSRGCWALLILGAGFNLPSLAAPPAREAEYTLEAVEKAWRVRQQKVRTFRFHCDERQTYTKGSYLSGKKPEPSNPHRLVVPPETTTYDTSFSMTMDGDKLRYFSSNFTLTTEGKLVPQKGTTVSTSVGVKDLQEPGATSYPRGNILPPVADGLSITAPGQVALLLTFRPLHPATIYFRNVARRYVVVPGRSVFAERSCVQLKEVGTDPRFPITSVWLDPERDFVVVRMVQDSPTGPLSQLTFEEFRQTENGWVPLKWTKTSLNSDGSVSTSCRASVRHFTLNVLMDEKEFELEFPPGTWVTDGREKTRYILKEGGEKRIILGEELVGQASYEQLLNTETGQALEYTPDKPRADRRWLFLALAVIAAALVALVLVKRLRLRLGTRPRGAGQP